MFSRITSCGDFWRWRMSTPDIARPVLINRLRRRKPAIASTAKAAKSAQPQGTRKSSGMGLRAGGRYCEASGASARPADSASGDAADEATGEESTARDRLGEPGGDCL